jgi:proline iminopeptidase
VNTPEPTQSGLLEIDDAAHKVYFERYGSASETLLVLHGGPGGSSALMRPFSALTTASLQVVMWDQLGGGKSDRPDDDSLWNVDRFVSEVEAVRTALGLERVHLLGQSWGGMLSLSYALAHPQAVASLTLSGTPVSAPLLLASIIEQRLALGPVPHMELLRHEAAGSTNEDDYLDLVIRLHARVTRRSTPYEPARSDAEFRDLVLPTFEEMGRVYRVMWGEHSFDPTGTLLTWDVLDRLSEIKVPTLVLCGAYDAVTPDMHRLIAEGIADSRFVIFGQSSHVISLELEADVYMDVIRGFLARAVDAESPRAGRDTHHLSQHVGKSGATTGTYHA